MGMEEMVPINDATHQVKKTAIRLALLHLGFSKVLSNEFGEEKAKELIIKSILEYGRLIQRYQKQDNLPHYGIYEKQSYKGQEFMDIRKIPLPKDEAFDLKQYKVYGCALATTFQDLNEEELGRLYCYIDAAKSMAEDPEKKMIHTKCAQCGDDHCAFEFIPTTKKEKKDFRNNDPAWREIDPLLLKGDINEKKETR
jgi:hypothetical protein